MGVKTTNKFAGPRNQETPLMDGHCDKYYNTDFDKGKVYLPEQPLENNFGDGSDGALDTQEDLEMANVTYPVTQDGDAVVKQYSSITINAGDTVTVDNRCKGLIIYCKGDCTIDGTLSMTEKGAKSDAPGAPDINPAGIRWVWYNPGSSDGPVSGPDVPLEALGPAAEAISNGGAWGRSDVVLTTSAFAGGSGSSSPDSGNTPWGSQSDRVGGTATNGTGGGGAAAGDEPARARARHRGDQMGRRPPGRRHQRTRRRSWC